MAVSIVKPGGPRKIKKPKVPPQIKTNLSNAVGPTTSIGAAATPKPPAAAPTATAPPSTAKAPSQADLAARPGFKAPETTQGAGIRSRAQGTYEAALRTGRQGIVTAALRLGSPEILNALKADPAFAEYAATLDGGIAKPDPTSLFAQSDYNEGIGLEGIDSSANQGNTYFSSNRERDRGRLDKSYMDAKSGYLSDYQTNYNTLMGGMGTALGDYNRDLTDADTVDTNAFLALTPQAEATAGGDAGAAAPAGPPPEIPGLSAPQVQQVLDFLGSPNFGSDMPGMNPNRPLQGYKYVQTTGPRKGLSYNEEIRHGKKIRIYSNGDRIQVG